MDVLSPLFSIGPLLAEVGQSPENSLFNRIADLLLVGLASAAVLVLLHAALRLLKSLFDDGDGPE